MNKIIASLSLIMVLLVACSPVARSEDSGPNWVEKLTASKPNPMVTLEELNSGPEKYEGKTLRVEGEVIEFLGENSHFILLPYMSPRSCKIGNSWTICTDIRLSFSEVRVAEFTFQSGASKIVVSERSGATYLPLPVVFAGEPELPEGKITLEGVWSSKKDGGYILYISGVDKPAE